MSDLPDAKPLEGEATVTMTAFFSVPKSWSKKR